MQNLINKMNNVKTIGITGVSGSLGKELTKIFRNNGYKVIGITHSQKNHEINKDSPDELVMWECGKEFLLEKHLKNIDILILNHGIYDVNKKNLNFENSIEINALSKFRFLNLFEEIAIKNNSEMEKEIWINTSEAEIFPALNPSYEISKSLIGQLASFKKNLLDKNAKKKFKIRKLILGPFKSELNPIGIMSAEFVASSIFNLASLNIFLIIISPNPLSYILFPIKEFYYFLYCKILKLSKLIN